ncbi:TPA: hypothetical protein N0F65_004094 [Lagenidium giganteum]|uniref:EF-hand domain-containing protein n=1 Tax=Lagenidium giganteum TaxID=4803 RepID=A0AAV2ZDQ8_9STRA|nr:TPA: hypothetical protein N0F65_004094 [Lagenidium giganteum]
MEHSSSACSAPTSPQHKQRQYFQHGSRVSPRQVRLQRVEPYTFALRDQISSNFRHELFAFHQLLRDAIDKIQKEERLKHGYSVSHPHPLLSRERPVLELLTSDRGHAILKEFFVQWQNQHKSAEEEELLWGVLDTLFRNLPMIVSEGEASNAKAFFRYVDAVKSLRDVLTSVLYKTPDATNTTGDAEVVRVDDDDDSDAEQLDLSSLISSSSTLLDANHHGGGARASKANTKANGKKDTHRPEQPRIPLYLYCRQLERELDTLRSRRQRLHLATAASEDIGLLEQNTLTLLLDFWELPRKERLGFLCQVATHGTEDDAEMVFAVLLENCSSHTLLNVWEGLLASRRLQNLAAFRAKSIQLGAMMNKDPPAADATAEGDASPEQDKLQEAADVPPAPLVSSKRGSSRRSMRGSPRYSRYVDLNGLAGAFEEDDETLTSDSDDSDDSDVSRRKIRIRERGRTPPSHRRPHLMQPHREHPHEGHHHHRHHHHQHHHHGHSPHRSDGDDKSVRTRAPSPTPTKERERNGSHASVKVEGPVLERLHHDLIEILKEDRPDVPPVVADAAWKLLEQLDGLKGKDTNSGFNKRRLVMKDSSTQPHFHQQQHEPAPPRQTLNDAIGANLTQEQMYIMKLDQMQSIVSAVAPISIHTFSTDSIAAIYHRLSALSKQYSAYANQTMAAAGFEPPPLPDRAGSKLTIPATPVQDKEKTPMVDTATDTECDDETAVAVHSLMGNMGKVLRTIAPLTAVGGGESSEIMQLANELEAEPLDTIIDGRRGALDVKRKTMMLSRLRVLANGNMFHSVSGIIANTCDGIVMQQRRGAPGPPVEQPSSPQFTQQVYRTPRRRSKYDEATSRSRMDERDDDEPMAVQQLKEEADEVIKLAKKAKGVRRASMRAQAMLEQDSEPAGGAASSSSSPRHPGREIPVSIKQASNAQRGQKLFNIGILLRIIAQMYRENYESTITTMQYGNRRMEFSEFMYDWHIRKYGLKALAQQHLLKLIQSLRKYEKKVFHCQLCLRFLSIQNPLGYHEHKYLLGLLDKWSLGTFSGATKNRVEHTPRQFKIRIVHAIATIQEALTERFGAYFRNMDAIATRIRAQALRFDEEFVKESDVLAIAIDEWLLIRKRIEQILEAVYVAGDLNGDGSLEYEEFSAVIFHLAPSLDEKFTQKVFTAAHDFVKPRRISFARFIDVILLERILNTNKVSAAQVGKYDRDRERLAAGGSSMAASMSGTLVPVDERVRRPSGSLAATSSEEEEEYQFNLLQETWEHDHEIVKQVLAKMTHQQTAAAITFRATFLSQILMKRVDSKTAWMCHRHIMREISRYQDLNEEEIVTLKDKEETFKKAVTAIRNMVRMGAFRSKNSMSLPVPGPELFPQIGLDGTRSSSYTSVVENLTSKKQPSTMEEIMELEDQLREKFVEQADEASIEDYKIALQQIRRISLQNFLSGLTPEQIEALNNVPAPSSTVATVPEDDEEDDDDEEELEDEEEGDEEAERDAVADGDGESANEQTA